MLVVWQREETDSLPPPRPVQDQAPPEQKYVEESREGMPVETSASAFHQDAPGRPSNLRSPDLPSGDYDAGLL